MQAETLPARRKWLYRLSALLLGPMVALGGLEGALRISGYGHRTDFFNKLRIGREEFLVNNEAFSLRFFPPELARFAKPFVMPAKKSPDTYRIFILGESAAMGDPEPAYGAGRYLEALLGERFPGTKFEVVNLGITAINSHAILPIARECALHDADLWIIYMGNNEMVGPFGAATVFGAQAPPLWFVRLNLAAQKLRLGQLMRDLLGRVYGKTSKASVWGGMEMFIKNRLPSESPGRERVYRNFQRNLQAIARTGLDSGAKVILSTVAVNLKDCPPFASLSAANMPAAQRTRGDELYAAGCLAQSEGKFGAAAQSFEEAAKLDSSSAKLQYAWAECLLGETNLALAHEHFQQACDLDALPFRADSRINDIIRKVGQQFANRGLVLCEPERELATNNAMVLGQETFFEHVHFNPEGNYRLGRAWAGQVEPLVPAVLRSHPGIEWLAKERCDRRLGLTDWNLLFVVQTVIRRLHQPPLSSQPNNAARLEALESQQSGLRRRMNPAAAASAREDFVKALEQQPGDHFLRENFADLLEAIGDLKQAAVEWQKVQELLPHDFLAYFQAGRLLGRLGQWADAQWALSRAMALRPGLADGWFELGNIHLAQSKFDLAVAEYERASRLRPQDAGFCCAKGKALEGLNRRGEAIEAYRQATQLKPDFWEAHKALADEWAAVERTADAIREYEIVIRLKPDYSTAHLNLGVLFVKQGRIEEGLGKFQDALRLEPGNKTAQDYFDRVQARKNRK